MDTEKCAALLRALQTGNLTEAARELGYTVSGISRMMASLEQETGFPLLHRSRSGVTPTEECRQLLPVMEELVRQSRLYRETADGIRGLETGEVRIGTAYAFYYQELGPIITAFTKAHPGIHITVQESFSSALAEGLSKHELDLCIISRREGDFDWTPLPRDHMCAWVPAEDPRYDMEVFPMNDFETDSCIEIAPGEETDNQRVFRAYHITPNYRITAMNDYSALAMVQAGLGVTMGNFLYQNTSAGKDVRMLPLDPDPVIEIGIAAARPAQLSPAGRKFCRFALERFGEGISGNQ